MNSVARAEAEAWIGQMVPPMVRLLQTIIGDAGVAFASGNSVVVLVKGGSHVLVRFDPAEVSAAS